MGKKVFISDENGYAAVLFALLMPVLIAFAGVVIDGGLIMYGKAKLEAATIAAYDEEIWEETGEVVIDEYNAILYAQAYLEANLPEARVVDCEVEYDDVSAVIVTTEYPVELAFARIYGVNEITIQTQGIGHGGGNGEDIEEGDEGYEDYEEYEDYIEE